MTSLLRFFSTLLGRILLGCAVLLLLYTGLGFFLVPYIAKQQIQKNTEERLGAKPSIGKISFNPFTFEASIEGFDLPEAKAAPGEKSRLKFDKFYVNLSWYPLLKKEIHLQDVDLKNANGQFTIFRNGGTNWEIKELPSDKEKSKQEQSNWVLFIEHVQVKNSKLDFRDTTHNIPLDLPMGPVSLSASNISTTLGSKTSLDSLAVAVGEKGHIKISGSVSPKPFSADLKLDMAEIPLEFLTAYLSDKTYLILKQGTIDVTGGLKYQKGDIQFDGDSTVHGLVLDQEGAEKPVVTWDALKMKGVFVQTAPMKVRVEEAELVKVDTAIILRADGTLNYKSVLRSYKPPTPEELAAAKAKVKSAAKAAPPAPVEPEPVAKGGEPKYLVNKLIVTDGILDYADEQIKPHFRAHVHNIDGTVGPLSENPGQKINIALTGQVEAYGKFEGKGYFIPGVKRPSLNLAMGFHNIEMTTFTPYSGRFAGYTISKGKLFLDFTYTLVNNRIHGDNQVVLDQFTLGDKVDSDKAPHWPLKLALALMKDRQGQIKFKLPVEGDVNDPKFSWGNLIWTAFKNMIVNIVSAPFDFLASLFGGGKDLQTVFFEPGTTTPVSGEEVKIQNLAKALEERPNISLEIKGQYQTQDLEAMQIKVVETRLDPVLKSHKGDRDKAMLALAKDMMKHDELKDFEKAFKSAHGDSDNGIADDLQKKIASTVQIPPEQIKQLALGRGNAVMAALVAAKIDAQRLYLLAGEKAADDSKPPHVLLNLKEK